MTTRKRDRRIARTQKVLEETLIQLILEKGYDQISVREICERADVGRTTFYAHYLDKNDLLEKTFGEVTVGMNRLFTVNDGQVDLSVRFFFEHAQEVPNLVKAFLHEPSLYQHTHQQLVTAVVEQFSAVHPQANMVEERLRAEYMIGGIVAVLRWWVDADMPISADEATAIVTKFSEMHGRSGGIV